MATPRAIQILTPGTYMLQRLPIGRPTVRVVVAVAVLSACAPDEPVEHAEPAPAADLPAAPDLVLSTDDATSVVGSSTAETELRERFGDAQVRSTDIYVGEGQSEPGTVLFPDDPTRTADILWHDPDTRTRPQRVMIRGQRSAWSMPPGISLGIPLDSLERLNQAPFLISGFGWDYEGTVYDWVGGELERYETDRASFLIRLSPPPGTEIGDADMREIGGEGPFPSDLPAMRRLNPHVYEMGVRFHDAGSDVRGTVVATRHGSTGVAPDMARHDHPFTAVSASDAAPRAARSIVR